jgi:rfaE bifunctional protein nucleotidyltransferase chain/domain
MTTKTASKILTRDALSRRLQELRAGGKKIGFTSGVFDLLHVGHTEYLEAAKALCDVLIVGVNSDASVKSYKSPERPIVPEADRAGIVAALAAVDFVFIFNESNNAENIAALKPDFYIKGQDYNSGKLSSGKAVEAYGGQIAFIKLRENRSSTGIIDRILNAYGHVGASHETLAAGPARPAIFLDRDGVINKHVEYLHEPAKFEFEAGTLEALERLREAGYWLVVVTNQPGIGLGYFTKEDFFKVNSAMLRQASKAGVVFDRVYFCPHSAAETCGCRKPKFGMLERASKELPIIKEQSWMVGDSTSDVACGKGFGVRTVLVATGVGGKDGACDVAPDLKAANLLEAAEAILRTAKLPAKK